MSGEFGTGKTVFVLAVVVGCFAVLWPKIFYPMLTASVKPASSSRQASAGWEEENSYFLSQLCFLVEQQQQVASTVGTRSDFDCIDVVYNLCQVQISESVIEDYRQEQDSTNLTACLASRFSLSRAVVAAAAPPRVRSKPYESKHVRPERPAHLYPEMMHPALREKGRALPQRTIEKQARPGPMPGVRPPLGGAGGMIPPSQGNKGSGAMGIIMPLYTVGIIIFFVYTIMKVLFKKGNDDTTPKLKDFHLDPEYRKYVFAEEYMDKSNANYRQHVRRRDDSRGSRKRFHEPDTKIEDEQMTQLRRRLEETEKAMERLMDQMGTVTDKLTAAKITEVLTQAQAQAKILKDHVSQVNDVTSDDDLTTSDVLTTTMSDEDLSFSLALERELRELQVVRGFQGPLVLPQMSASGGGLRDVVMKGTEVVEAAMQEAEKEMAQVQAGQTLEGEKREREGEAVDKGEATVARQSQEPISPEGVVVADQEALDNKERAQYDLIQEAQLPMPAKPVPVPRALPCPPTAAPSQRPTYADIGGDDDDGIAQMGSDPLADLRGRNESDDSSVATETGADVSEILSYAEDKPCESPDPEAASPIEEDTPEVAYPKVAMVVPEVTCPQVQVPEVSCPRVGDREVPEVVYVRVESHIPEVSYPKVEEPQVPEVSYPRVGEPQVPEVSYPRVEEPQAPEVSYPKVEEPQVPEVSYPRVKESQVPEVSYPKVEEPQVPEVSWTRVDESQVPEVSHIRAEEPQASEVSYPTVEEPQAPEASYPRVEESQVPEVLYTKVEEPQVPEGSYRRVEEPKVPEVSYPRAEEPQEPEVSHPRVEKPQVPEVSYPRFKETQDAGISYQRVEGTHAPEVIYARKEEPQEPEDSFMRSEDPHVPEVSYPRDEETRMPGDTYHRKDAEVKYVKDEEPQPHESYLYRNVEERQEPQATHQESDNEQAPRSLYPTTEEDAKIPETRYQRVEDIPGTTPYARAEELLESGISYQRFEEPQTDKAPYPKVEDSPYPKVEKEEEPEAFYARPPEFQIPQASYQKVEASYVPEATYSRVEERHPFEYYYAPPGLTQGIRLSSAHVIGDPFVPEVPHMTAVSQVTEAPVVHEQPQIAFEPRAPERGQRIDETPAFPSSTISAQKTAEDSRPSTAKQYADSAAMTTSEQCEYWSDSSDEGLCARSTQTSFAFDLPKAKPRASGKLIEMGTQTEDEQGFSVMGMSTTWKVDKEGTVSSGRGPVETPESKINEIVLKALLPSETQLLVTQSQIGSRPVEDVEIDVSEYGEVPSIVHGQVSLAFVGMEQQAEDVSTTPVVCPATPVCSTTPPPSSSGTQTPTNFETPTTTSEDSSYYKTAEAPPVVQTNYAPEPQGLTSDQRTQIITMKLQDVPVESSDYETPPTKHESEPIQLLPGTAVAQYQSTPRDECDDTKRAGTGPPYVSTKGDDSQPIGQCSILPREQATLPSAAAAPYTDEDHSEAEVLQIPEMPVETVDPLESMYVASVQVQYTSSPLNSPAMTPEFEMVPKEFPSLGENEVEYGDKLGGQGSGLGRTQELVVGDVDVVALAEAAQDIPPTPEDQPDTAGVQEEPYVRVARTGPEEVRSVLRAAGYKNGGVFATAASGVPLELPLTEEESKTSSKGSSPDMDDYEVINKEDDETKLSKKELATSDADATQGQAEIEEASCGALPARDADESLQEEDTAATAGHDDGDDHHDHHDEEETKTNAQGEQGSEEGVTPLQDAASSSGTGSTVQEIPPTERWTGLDSSREDEAVTTTAPPAEASSAEASHVAATEEIHAGEADPTSTLRSSRSADDDVGDSLAKDQAEEQ